MEGVPALGCQDSALRPKAKARSRSEQNSGETDEGKTSEDVFWRPKWDFDSEFVDLVSIIHSSVVINVFVILLCFYSLFFLWVDIS